MPWGCVNHAVLGVTSIVGGGGCGLPGTFTRIQGFVPPAPQVSQNTLPKVKVAVNG